MSEAKTDMPALLDRMAAALETAAELQARTADLLEADARHRSIQERREHYAKVSAKAVRKAEADGKPPLRRMGAVGWINAIPGLAAKWAKVVPEKYITVVNEALVVACPCRTLEPPTLDPLSLIGCVCGRWYCRDADGVHVFRPEESDAEDEQGTDPGTLRDRHQGQGAAAG